MTVNYSRNMHISGGITAYSGMTDVEWHQAAIADTGESHMKAARVAVVQCLWCDEAFIAKTVAEAMSMFRAHEDEMLGSAPEVTP